MHQLTGVRSESASQAESTNRCHISADSVHERVHEDTDTNDVCVCMFDKRTRTLPLFSDGIFSCDNR